MLGPIRGLWLGAVVVGGPMSNDGRAEARTRLTLGAASNLRVRVAVVRLVFASCVVRCPPAHVAQCPPQQRMGGDDEHQAHNRLPHTHERGAHSRTQTRTPRRLLLQVYICESLGLPEIAQFWMGIIRMNDVQKLRFSRRCSSFVRHLPRPPWCDVFPAALCPSCLTRWTAK